MSDQRNGQIPRPRRRLLRTWLSLPRSVKPFYRPLTLQEPYADPAPLEEVAHWGRIEVLDESLVVLHRDGTTTIRTHYIAHLHRDQDLREWEAFSTVYRRRHRRPRIVRSILHLPDGSRQKARVRDQAIDATGNRVLVADALVLRAGSADGEHLRIPAAEPSQHGMRANVPGHARRGG